MGQYKSYKNLSLEKKLTKLETEINSLKVKQLYGMQQVGSFTSNILKVNSAYSDTGWGGALNSTNILHLRFTGNKPKKTVVCRLVIDYHGATNLWVLDTTYVHQCPGDKPNEWDIWCYIYTMSDYNNDFYVNLSVQSNEIGTLKIADEYSRAGNPWIVGG